MEQSKLTLLSLPLNVREGIYIIVGLVRRCAINLQEEQRRWSKIRAGCKRDARDPSEDPSAVKIFQWHTPGPLSKRGHTPRCAFDMKLDFPDYGRPGNWCVHDRLPLELLQISRDIRKEAMFLFCSRNTFVIDTTWLSMKTMSWLRLDLLRSIEVQLTTCSCIPGHKCPEPAQTYYQEFNRCSLCHYGCKRGLGEPLAIEDVESQVIFEDWSIFCESLKQNRSAGLKNFSLIADCEDNATALTVVQPLEGFPALENASIRLGQSADSELSSLARKVVQKMTRVDDHQAASLTARKLPLEVLELILQHTDLVTDGYLSWFEPPLSDRQDQFKYRQKRIFQGLWQFNSKGYICCVQCTLAREVCACPSRHAAFSSNVCQCWHYPKSLFLVSKAFYAMAVEIFCSRNRFILFEWAPDHGWDENLGIKPNTKGCERLLMPLNFIQEMPQTWSQHIQWLKLRGLNFRWNEGLADEDFECYSSWETLSWSLKQWRHLDRLTVEFDVSSDYDDWELGLVIPHGQDDAGQESLWNIIKLFKLPDGKHNYKDFFVRFDHEVSTTQQEDTRWHLERQMEKYLMGRNYDAAARGKYHNKRQYNESLRPKRLIADFDITMQLTEEDLYGP